MTICFENETDQELDFDYENILEKVIRQAAEQEKCPYEFEVNVTFTDNDSIREINREFRELDVPTDVLSFPTLDLHAIAEDEEPKEIITTEYEDRFVEKGNVIYFVEVSK